MKKEKTKFDKDELELVRVQLYDGYDIEQPRWTFLSYAVVTPSEDGRKVDVIDERVYIPIEEDEKKGFFQRENLEKNAIRIFSTPENEVFHQLLSEKDNDIEGIKHSIIETGFYFHYDTELIYAPSLVKTFKR